MRKSRVIYYPKGLEITYKVKLLQLIDVIEKTFYDEMSLLERKNFNNDSFADEIEELIDRVKIASEDIELAILTGLTRRLVNVVRLASNMVKESLSDLTSSKAFIIEDIDTTESSIIDFLPMLELNELVRSSININVRLIKSIPTDLLDDLSYVLEDGFRSGKSLREINAELISKFNISRNRASVIARTEIAKLHSNTLREEYLKLGIEHYEWHTSSDERVRSSHKVLNKKICRWNDASVYKDDISDKEWKKRSSILAVEKQAGEDIQCRCSIIAIIN